MKKYKTILSAQNAQEIIMLIGHLYNKHSEEFSVSEAIAFAVLVETVLAIKKKTVEYRREYSFSFTATQAIALSYMYRAFIEGSGNENQFTNRMMQINNEVLQHYSISF